MRERVMPRFLSVFEYQKAFINIGNRLRLSWASGDEESAVTHSARRSCESNIYSDTFLKLIFIYMASWKE
jgi:hypothetical protein